MDSRQVAKANVAEMESFVSFYSKTTPYKEWVVTVEWSEPDQMIWSRFNATGPLNQRFIDWLNRHWDYWQDKAKCNVSIIRIVAAHTVGNYVPAW